MPEVTIKIEATPTTDTLPRYHGKAIDQTLNTDFWLTQKEKMISNPDWGEYPEGPAYDSAFTHTETVTLAEGKHTIRYAPSSSPGYEWKATIYINDESLGEQTGLTRDKQYTAEFTVGEPAGGLLFGWEAFGAIFENMMSMMMMFMMMGLMMSMITVAIRGFAPE